MAVCDVACHRTRERSRTAKETGEWDGVKPATPDVKTAGFECRKKNVKMVSQYFQSRNNNWLNIVVGYIYYAVVVVGLSYSLTCGQNEIFAN